jgi:hypothetical protein
MGEACSMHESDDNFFYEVAVGKFQGYRPTGKPRGKWEDNIKICF